MLGCFARAVGPARWPSAPPLRRSVGSRRRIVGSRRKSGGHPAEILGRPSPTPGQPRRGLTPV